MKLDWEKTGEYGSLYSWNTCSLPRVTSKDNTVVTLEQLLKIPKNLPEITEEMAMRTQEKEWCATISSHDDTLDDSKKSQRDLNTATESQGPLKPTMSYENIRKQHVPPRYYSAEKDRANKSKKVILLKYEPSPELKLASTEKKIKEEAEGESAFKKENAAQKKQPNTGKETPKQLQKTHAEIQ
ncbi:hypothetical protein RB195_006996 [Necator americanus]